MEKENSIKSGKAAEMQQPDAFERTVRELVWVVLGILGILLLAYLIFGIVGHYLDADMDLVNAARGGA